MQKIIFSLLILLISIHSFAQHKLTVTSYEIHQNENDFLSGSPGIEIDLEIKYPALIENFSEQRYEMDWVLNDNTGKSVYTSRFSSNEKFRSANIYLSKPYGVSDPDYMTEKLSIFIPYEEIKLTEGKHRVSLVLTAFRSQDPQPDFYSIDFELDHKIIRRYSIEEQKFEVKIDKIEYGVLTAGMPEDTYIGGFQVKGNLLLNYTGNEAADQEYELFWQWLDETGTLIADSRNARYSTNTRQKLETKVHSHKIYAFTHYHDIDQSGTGKATLVLKVRNKDGVIREVYQQEFNLEIPVKYAFEDQEYSVQDISISPDIKHGVQGIMIRLEGGFKYSGPLMDPEKGTKFWFYTKLYSGDKLIWSPEGSEKYHHYTTVTYDGVPADPRTPSRVNIFVPFHRLDAMPGALNVRCEVFMTDAKHEVSFTRIAEGDVSCTMPEIIEAKVEVDYVEVEHKKYDFALLGTGAPDLVWSFSTGKDHWYTSSKAKNSWIGTSGRFRIKLSKGDELNFNVYDKDSGFFNMDDYISSLKIMYDGKKNYLLKDYKDGHIIHLDLKILGL